MPCGIGTGLEFSLSGPESVCACVHACMCAQTKEGA